MLGTLKTLTFEEATAHVDAGGAFVDLRDIQSYLDVHIPGSIALLYESGPGMAARARDCLPLEMPLLVADPGTADVEHAAASLRGKGFTVLGRLDDAINRWAERRGPPASTEVLRDRQAPDGTLLDVGDPGASDAPGAVRIPVERLWSRIDEVRASKRVTVVAGRGVRAALAIGLLERAGIPEVLLWKPS